MSEQQIRKKIEVIQKEINNLLQELDGKKEQNAFQKAIDRKTLDNEYIDALKQLKKRPYKLSAKQFAWIVAFTRFHVECGQQIISFFKSQLKREKRDRFVETVAAMLRKNYMNEYNQDFIEGAIKTIKELEV